MATKSLHILFTFGLGLLLLGSFPALHAQDGQPPYDGSWESLQKMPVPAWFDDGKIGIFIHWGPYSEIGYRKGGRGYAEHVPKMMYRDPDHYFPIVKERWGSHPPEFGYKDIIPEFQAENWDPDAWAELFEEVGAKYVVMTAEHHDGWANWDSDLTPWNAVDMGPKRDLVGDLGIALRKRGLKYAPSYHRERHQSFYAQKLYVVNAQPLPMIVEEIKRVPEAASLYGPFGTTEAFVDDYVARWKEIQAKYQPDMLWMDDFPIYTRDGNKVRKGRAKPEIQYFDDQVRAMITDFMNDGVARGANVYVNNKGGNRNWPDGVGCLEKDNLKLKVIGPKWQSCTTFGTSFGYLEGDKYKTVESVIHEMIEVISRNGNFLINIGPKGDGTLVPEQVERLQAMGSWLKINGPAIYGSRYWSVNEQAEGHLAFTTNGNNLYAIALESPVEPITIAASAGWPADEVTSVRLLGSDAEVTWAMTDAGLRITPPADLGASQYAWSFEIVTTKAQHVPSSIQAKATEALKGTKKVDLDGNSSVEPEEEVQGNAWIIDSQTQWQEQTIANPQIRLADGLATPTAKSVTLKSKLKRYPYIKSASSIVVRQTTAWQNWTATDIGPQGTRDAPVLLRMGEGDYWFFAKAGRPKKNPDAAPFVAQDAQVEGFDMPLKTTPFPNQYDAPGGLKKRAGGYHAWQSHDMKSWVHHGSVTNGPAGWVTTAELVDGKVYLYYDFPNDQDPHLVIDENLFDGVPGKTIGMVFDDPSDGSDVAMIRDLDGKFHCIYEDWSPIDPSTHSWDSPLAGHAVSPDGIKPFEIVGIAVDERTKPTGKFAEYFHPHWHAAAPEKFPAKAVPKDIPKHRLKKGVMRAFSQYEIHKPEQDAYGDWAAISIGGQYYLFCDFDPAISHDRTGMSVGWFTSSAIDKPFKFCGKIGSGHPDPDIMFAEGQFYLATQTQQDFVSPGPWVDGVEVRVGVDTDNDATIDHWSPWQGIKESYAAVPGFAKQVAKTPALMKLNDLPQGHGFQFEVRLSDTTENDSKPILDRVELKFAN